MSGFDEFVTADNNGDYDTAFIEELRTNYDKIREKETNSKEPEQLHVKHKILSQQKNLGKFMESESN
jgi:hypothetical protein